MLAGKDAELTTVAYGADDVATSIDLALNRTNLPGLVRVARINANLRMPPMVMAASANPAYLLGQGPVTQDDLPALVKQLHSADEIQRTEADSRRPCGALSKRSGRRSPLRDTN